jgi:hypothetical protein
VLTGIFLPLLLAVITPSTTDQYLALFLLTGTQPSKDLPLNNDCSDAFKTQINEKEVIIMQSIDFILTRPIYLSVLM